MTSIANGSGIGGGGSSSLDAGANDTRGEITINTGTGVGANANLATVTFGSAYANAPYVHLTRGDQAALTQGLADITVINKTTTGFDIAFAAGGGATFSSVSGLKWDYLVTA